MFQVEKKIPNSLGRAGVLKTPHGDIKTPAFVAVGTKATVKSITPEQLATTGAQVMLANTYHLLLQPGDEVLKSAGGLHTFMNWPGPTMTDSGGFQAFSLGVAYGQGIGKFIGADTPEPEVLEEGFKEGGKAAKVTEEGVEFKSIIDGSTHFLSPEKSIQVQHNIGADIIFALDEFTSPHADFDKIKSTIERTERWAGRCLEEHKTTLSPNSLPLTPPEGRGTRFGWETADKSAWVAIQDRAVEMRKNPTRAEEILWKYLKANIIGFHFRRQHVIGQFVADFVCLQKSLVVEIDGDIHDYQIERDKERTNFLEQSGFQVIRFRNEEVLYNVQLVLDKILAALKALPFGEGLGEAQALFGIVQGGRYEELRKLSATQISAMPFDGFGIGGTFVKEDMATAVHWVNEILPEDKPRHLLGVGEPLDLILGVENGCDTFDCVAPTRMARNGALYTRHGKINILNAKYKNLFEPIEPDCSCYTCTSYTCAYLNHLFKAKEMLGATLATIHNLHFLNSLMSDIRQSILDGNFYNFKEDFLSTYKF